MPAVLIVSDNHGSTKELADIKARHTADFMIHCGDSELGMDDPYLEGFIKVAGNCDSDARLPKEQVVSIRELTFFIAHGHRHQVKTNLMTIAYHGEEENAQVVCFGHTHIAGAEKAGNQLLINPGSILLPRNRSKKTYAMLVWDSLDEINVNFYTDAGEIVKELSFTTSLV